MKEGELAPEEWRGTLSTEYYLGPDLKYPNWTIKMDIRTANRMATIYNTIGLIRGEIEPGAISIYLKLFSIISFHCNLIPQIDTS